jgi:hypothetical protein
MHVQVKYQNGVSVPGANVKVIDAFSTEYFGTADANGHLYYIVCYDYKENKRGIIKNYNDCTVTAGDGTINGIVTPNPTMDQTKIVIITLLDTKKPVFVNDLSDTTATTGDPFTFRVEITDNVAISTAHVVYWFGSGAEQNHSFLGSPYNRTINAPSDSLDKLQYYFTAADFGGNWLVTSQNEINVTDNDAPTSIADTSDTMVVYGMTFDLAVDGVDNIDVTIVNAVWWFDQGSTTNDSLTGTGPFTGTIAVPVSGVKMLHYYFELSDAANPGNWLIGQVVDINVTDNVPPEVEILLPADNSMISGTIKLELNASDANSGFGLVNVKINTVPATELYNQKPGSQIFSFDFDTTTVADGLYVITAMAVDQKGLLDSDSINITIDNTPPDVDAGPDVNIETGEKVSFDGTGSTDNYGIANYTWTFTYDGGTQTLYGTEPEFTFDIEGTYDVTLTVTDLIGNSASDTMTVTVTKPVIPPPARPKVVETTPADESTDVQIDTTVTIEFDIAMNESITEGVLGITPIVGFNTSWNDAGTILTITFTEDLWYNATYTITIGDAKATTGGILQDAPFSFKFVTEKTTVIPPPQKTVTIETIEDEDIKPGDTILVSGTSTGFDEGSLSVSIDDKTDSETVTVEKPLEQKKEAEDDNTMFYLILIIIIVVVLLAVMMLMRKKKPSKEPEPEETEEFEEE